MTSTSAPSRVYVSGHAGAQSSRKRRAHVQTPLMRSLPALRLAASNAGLDVRVGD